MTLTLRGVVSITEDILHVLQTNVDCLPAEAYQRQTYKDCLGAVLRVITAKLGAKEADLRAAPLARYMFRMYHLT